MRVQLRDGSHHTNFYFTLFLLLFFCMISKPVEGEDGCDIGEMGPQKVFLLEDPYSEMKAPSTIV